MFKRRWRKLFLLICGFGAGLVMFSTRLYEDPLFSRRLPSFEDLGNRIVNIGKWNSSLGSDILSSGFLHKIRFRNAVVKKTPAPILKNHYIVQTGANGRLGNHLFQLASLIGTADYHRYIPVFPKSSALRNMFDINVLNNVPKLNNSKSFSERKAGVFDVRITNLSHDTNWTTRGYFQSWKYFVNSSDVVRKQLKIKAHILDQAKKLLPPAKGKVRVGVHVRRGDMNTKHELKRGYNVADVGYLNRSMTYYRNKFDQVQFVVVSDDIKWCQKNMQAPDVIFLRGSREVDLALLSICNHSVVTTGSYGWWGAWLAGGETVYFKDFPKNNSWLDKQYSKEDYYPPNWIGML